MSKFLVEIALENFDKSLEVSFDNTKSIKLLAIFSCLEFFIKAIESTFQPAFSGTMLIILSEDLLAINWSLRKLTVIRYSPEATL